MLKNQGDRLLKESYVAKNVMIRVEKQAQQEPESSVWADDKRLNRYVTVAKQGCCP